MGLIAGFLLDLQGKAGLAGWQWLFLIEGLPAIVLSVVFLHLLCPPVQRKPSGSPTRSGSGFSINAITVDAVDSHSRRMARALLDARVWQVSLVFLCMLTCSYAYTFSAPAILQAITASQQSQRRLPGGSNELAGCAQHASQCHALRPHQGALLTCRHPFSAYGRGLSDRRIIDSALPGGSRAGHGVPQLLFHARTAPGAGHQFPPWQDPPPLASRP